jgi:hypothetical protein
VTLRTMAWDEQVWQAFVRAAAYIPPAVRMEAVVLVVEQSERIARARGAHAVEERDLVVAAREKVPRAYRALSLQILEEQGIKVRDD